MKLKKFAIAIALSALLASGQQILNMSAVLPPPVTNLTATIVGTAGTASACYYIVTNYIGGAIRSAPICKTNIPNTLSGSNYVQLTWQPVPRGFGLTYDVLKTAYNVAPVQGAANGLSTGQPTVSYQDQGGALSPYTMNGFLYQQWTATCRLNNWDYVIPAVECPVQGGYPMLAQVPLADGNLGLQAHGSGTNIGIELLGKGTGGLYWDGGLVQDSTGAAPNRVYSVEATPSLAQVNAGYTLVAANAGQTLKVTHVLLTANGGSTAACTGVLVEDTNTSPVVAITALAAALTSGTPVDETIASVTPGAGFAPATLTAGQGLQIIKDGATACTTATSFSVIVFYKINS